MKVKSESEVAQSYPTLCDPMDCSLRGSSVHGIFQAGVLEWGAIAFSEVPQYMFLKSQGFDTWLSPLSSPLCNLLVRTLALTAASEGARDWASADANDLSTQFPSQTTISVVGQPLIQLSTQGNSFSQTSDPRVMNTAGGWKLGNQESEESHACCCCYSASLLSVTGDKQKSLGRPRIYTLGGLGENTSLAFLF